MLYFAVLLPWGFKSLAAFTETLDLLKFTFISSLLSTSSPIKIEYINSGNTTWFWSGIWGQQLSSLTAISYQLDFELTIINIIVLLQLMSVKICITCFFSSNSSRRCTRISSPNCIGGHHSKFIFHPGVELHSHGWLHVSCHWLWVCTQEYFLCVYLFRTTLQL